MGITRIPESIAEEHEELFEGLGSLAKKGNLTGKAISQLLAVLHPHFEKEDEIAMPLLGALPELSSGKAVGGLDGVLVLQGRLGKELPTMLSEHQRIGKLISNAKRAAQRERNKKALELLSALEHHAKIEEEVLYPAAMLTGVAAKQMQREVSA